MDLFDTHCHLNFQAFENSLDQVISEAKKAGVNNIIIPGTDVETSRKAVKIAEKYPGVFAAVGIHPHHVYQINQKRSAEIRKNQKPENSDKSNISDLSNLSGIRPSPISSDYSGLSEIERLLSYPKVVAVGEVGIDRHIYQKTVYKNYKINPEFIEGQKEFLKEQIKLAIEYDKSLILHNREAREDTLRVLRNVWDRKLEGRAVFHCCEPDMELLEFAKEHKMFIGVDGDVTYWKEKLFGFAQSKQEFIKKVPLNMLVLETDSPLLIPELSGSRSWTRYNEPKNLVLIAEFVAKLKNVSINQLIDTTTENAKKLFKI